MAISNDSFGSPGLGEGIGLQGTLKDYTPLIAKSRLAEQAMASKAAQKKLDAQLAEEEKLNQDLSKYKVFGAGIPAFTPAYKKISDDFMKTVQELKSKPGVPITSRIEYLQAKSKAQQEFDKLRFQEDALLPALKAAQTIDPKKQKVNTKLLNAYLDDTGESLKSQYGKIGLANEPLITDISQYNYFKDFGTITKSVVPKKSGTYTPVNIGGREGIQYTKDSEFTQQDIDNGWNRLKSTASYLNNLDETAKLMAGENATQDVIDNYKQIVEKQEEDAFRAQFKNSTITTASALYNTGYVSGSGIDALRKLNVSIGTLDPTVVQNQIIDNAYTNQILDTKETLLDLMSKDKNAASKLKYKNEKGELQPFTSLTPAKYIPLVVQYYNSKVDESVRIPVPKREAFISTGAKSEQQLKELLKNKDKIVSFQITDKGKQNPFIKDLIDENGNPVTGSPMGIIKVGDQYRFLINEEYVVGNRKEYGFITVPIEQNHTAVSTYLKVKDATEQDWINFYEEKAAKVQKKEQGGLVEPKEISKKFHDKSRNMTKFVYSDGSEEIFKGLL